MRRSARLSEKQAKPANEAQREPRAKKKRSNGRISKIATLDNGTMVEILKYLNYCQLAKNSLISKKFLNLICTHRHKLALLYVDSLVMSNLDSGSYLIEIFDQKLSPKEYDEWVIRNGYSKQIPLEGQVVRKQNAQYDSRKVYGLSANAAYNGSMNVFYAQTRLNHKNWPLFQHFVRLLMDPFIYIRSLKLISQRDVLNLLAGATDPDHSRLRCEKLKLDLEGNVPKFISWIKDNVRCVEFRMIGYRISNYDEELLDLFMSGAHCTSTISMNYSIGGVSTKIVVDLVQKFMDLKSSDECQMVESIRAVTRSTVVFELDHQISLTNDEHGTERVFEFVNNDVGKKLRLCDKIFDAIDYGATDHYCVLTINNL
ncbi:hypothetical protein Ddc_20289 [Ditylenchus destructor]|nr:hypothetical protein Ddc_20289 [Ditylenchus destructor]